MAVSWPFDSTVTQDGNGNPVYSRAYSSDVLAGILARYLRNGVFSDPSTCLQVLQNEDMTVLVKEGAANINGRQFVEESDRVLTVQAANASLDRIDTVVLRLNLAISALTIDLYVVEGTAAAIPGAPELTRNASVYELGLANLFIAKNTTSITQQRITDTRLDSDRCGVVASIIGDTDTSAYYAQIAADLASFKAVEQAAFQAWFATARNTLGEDAAGNLLTLIQAKQDALSSSNPLPLASGGLGGSAADAAAARNLINAQGKPVLLWTNPSPTSAFAAQTINLDLSLYSYILIVSRWSTGSAIEFETQCRVGKTTCCYSAYDLIRARIVTVNTASVVWMTGINAYYGASGATEDAATAIPVAIYGIV